MVDEILQMAEQEGFEQGWDDALRGMPQMPRPDIGYELIQPGYTKTFRQSYLDAFEAGHSERRRRKELQRGQTLRDDREQER